MKRFETTPGRMLLGETLPKSHKVPFETVNRLLTKKEIGDVIDSVYRHTGQKETVLFADAIMPLGFRHAFKAGISFGKDDMIIPRRQGGAGRGDPRAGEGLRAAVSGRPDHPAGKVQQGDRRLVALRRPGRERDDEARSGDAEASRTGASGRSTRST